MINRLALWTSVLAVIATLMVAGPPLAAQDDLPGTPVDESATCALHTDQDQPDADSDGAKDACASRRDRARD